MYCSVQSGCFKEEKYLNIHLSAKWVMCTRKWDFVGKECHGSLENGLEKDDALQTIFRELAKKKKKKKKKITFVNDIFRDQPTNRIFSEGCHFSLLALGTTNTSYANDPGWENESALPNANTFKSANTFKTLPLHYMFLKCH